MSDATEMKQATPERIARIDAYATPLADYIQRMPVDLGMETLLYVIVRCFMDIHPAPDQTHLTAFDYYMKAARHTLEKNLEAHARSLS